VAIVERRVPARTLRGALRFGARVRWQAEVTLDALARRRGAGRQIVVSSRPQRTIKEPGWVVVPEIAWTTAEPSLPPANLIRLPYPVGSADNRWGRRRREE